MSRLLALCAVLVGLGALPAGQLWGQAGPPAPAPLTTLNLPVPATAPAVTAVTAAPMAVPGTAPAAALPAAPKAPRPTSAVPETGCVTAACHANVKNYKVVHGPVNVNACNACHKLSDAAGHTFVLTREKKEICTFCHKVETAGMAVVHKPVLTGDCLACHNPHGGRTAKFVRGNTMNDLCKQCHKDVIGTKKMVHGPVAAGACEACHMPHASPNRKLLVADGRALCLGCHKEMGDQLRQTKVVHKPVANGECVECHDPHAADYAMQIKKAPVDLCTGCHEHEAIRTAALSATHKHSVVVTGRACLNCHTPHGGALPKLVKDEPLKVCMKCHEQKQTAPDGRTVASVAEVLDTKQFRHGPARDGNCGGCHNVHGSNFTRLLTKPYPEAFYQPFTLEKYDLCFSCHDKQLVLLENTQGLTGFRNGTRNLHYVHVNKADKGRSCRACHEPHASKQPLHLRESVPYGQWELPINYQKNATGGTCAPGCHKQLSYDRESPVAKPAATDTAGTTTAPAAPPPPATPPGATPPAATTRTLDLKGLNP